MKIFDKRIDFYDSIQYIAPSQNDPIRWNRKYDVIKNIRDEHAPQSVVKHRNLMKSSYVKLFMIENCLPVYLIIAGKIYNGIQLHSYTKSVYKKNRFNGYDRINPTETYYWNIGILPELKKSVEDLHPDNKFKVPIKELTSYLNYENDVSSELLQDKEFGKFPIIMYCEEYPSIFNLYINPLIKDCGSLFLTMDPYNIFGKIETYLSSFNNTEKVVEIKNEDKITTHGFDSNSFRNSL
jgi:hypothetical protein